MTNIFIVALSLISFFFVKKFSVKAIIKEFKLVRLRYLLLIVITVVASNISSLLGVYILKKVELIFYVPFSSALGLLAGETVAVFFAKEKPQIIATILAISSVLVVILF